jgi:hypothetical protein
MDIFVGGSQPNFLSNFLCTVTRGFDSWYQSTLLSAIQVIFSAISWLEKLVPKHGNSSSLIFKLDHTTYQNMFSFHSCASSWVKLHFNCWNFMFSVCFIHSYMPRSSKLSFFLRFSDKNFVCVCSSLPLIPSFRKQ